MLLAEVRAELSLAVVRPRRRLQPEALLDLAPLDALEARRREEVVAELEEDAEEAGDEDADTEAEVEGHAVLEVGIPQFGI